jgi:hypothetical protein
MSDTAVHLLGEVLPDVLLRHWVRTLPWGVVRTFAESCHVSSSIEPRRCSDSRAWTQALTGSVAVVQRTDGAIRLFRISASARATHGTAPAWSLCPSELVLVARGGLGCEAGWFELRPT